MGHGMHNIAYGRGVRIGGKVRGVNYGRGTVEGKWENGKEGLVLSECILL